MTCQEDDTKLPNVGKFEIQVWWDDGQINGWKGQTFKASCEKEKQHFFRISHGWTAGWVWVRGDSAEDAIINIATVHDSFRMKGEF